MGYLDLSLTNRFLLLAADPAAGHGLADLLNNVGLCVIMAAALAFVANKLRQPAILAYLLAGVLIGPEIGFRLITDPEIIGSVAGIASAVIIRPSAQSAPSGNHTLEAP